MSLPRWLGSVRRGADRGKPSALVVIGVYASAVAALAIVPVTLPLLYRLVLAENLAERSRILRHTAEIGLALDSGRPVDLGEALSVHAVKVDGAQLLQHGPSVEAPSLEDMVCASASGSRMVDVGGVERFAACFESRRLRVFALYPAPSRSYIDVAVGVVSLAIIAGLATALGTLRILRPIIRVGHMIDRVGIGERGVKMRKVGILEIDRLIERMNSLSVTVEEREHSILAQVQVAQEMARLVAHEVRNPLQSMELLTSLLAEEYDPAERKTLSESIHREIRTLDDVVTRLLREGATRGSLRLRLEPQDVDELLRHVATLKQQEAERQQATIHVRPGGVGQLAIDRPLLSRSIENLVTNALRAVPTPDGEVWLSSNRLDDTIQIVVEDNGPGIDPHLGDAIFDANVSGQGGNGLGLSLTRGVAEAHGGTATFEPAATGGARFVLTLPVRRPGVAEDSSA
jgi:signal transduction histidine kinase